MPRIGGSPPTPGDRTMHHPSKPRARVRLATLLAGLVVGAGLVATGAPGPAAALDPPSNLRASDAVNPVLAWDRVTGATGYDVELSRTAEFTAAGRIGSVVSTANVQYVPTVQLPAGTVHWRVRAKGAETGTYSVGAFTPATTAAPVPLRPEADRHFQAPETPYFTWEPVPGATSYTIQVGPDPQFVDTAVAGFATRTQKTTAAYLTGYQSAGTYFWRVRAELTSGYATPWTASSPYVVDGLPPVVRTAPVDGFDAAVRDVVLDWEPVPGAATYQLQVSTDDGFLTTVANPTGVVATQWSPTTTLPNDEYFWRVRAVDASGNAAPWPVTPWRFRRAWPHQPTLLHPVGPTDPATPFFFEWTAIERASKYTVVLYAADDPGQPVCTAVTVHTTYAPSTPDGCGPSAAGDYLWQVRATDEGGAAAPVTDLIGQPAAGFHYEPPAPTVAGTGLTVDSVTGQATSITGTAAFPDAGAPDACTAVIPATCVDLRQTPALSWDPTPGATSYRLTVAYDRELTNLHPDFRSAPVVLDQPLYTFTKTLPDSQAGSAYYWVVQPCGTTCAPIAHARHSFAKKSVAPTLVAPAADALVSDDVTLDWDSELDTLRAPGADTGSSLRTPAATEARTYTVQTSTSPTFATTIESVTTEETSFTSPSATYPEGYVYWRVRANDGSNNPTVWSEVRRFEKRSPVPTLLTPALGAALGADYTLGWAPLPFAASYDVEVYAGGSVTPIATANTKHVSWAPSDPFPVSATDYTWRVRRVDARGLKGDWSAVRTFRMEGFPLTAAAPAAGAVVAPTGGLFTWLPDARATSYRFERRKPNDPTNTVAETVTTRATAWAPTSGLAAGTAQWRVTALDVAGKDLGSSPWRELVVIDPPAVATPVTISGSGRVGTELRASAPTFDPVAESTTYQWYRGTTKITGATGEVYTVTSTDLAKQLTVEATGLLTGYRSATSRSGGILAVDGDALVATTVPAVEGDPFVGRTLTAVPGSWPGTPTVTRQWHRDGVAVAGATRTTYVLTAADLGHDLTVVETARRTGYADGTASSTPVPVLAPPTLVATAPPVVTGTPRVGQTLTAGPGTWPGSPRFAHQWFRGGTAIAGATRSTYTLTATDAARSVHVVVTATASGWSPGTAPSAARAVARLASTTAVTLSATRTPARKRVTATIRVAVSGLSAPGGTVTIYDGARKVATKAVGTGTIVFRLPRLAVGRHTVKAVYGGGTQVTGSTGTAKLKVTRR
ncbi:Ig-like domain repeat protein [Nocardioides sp. 1609]|uniref:Ig-like domain repeat protein n=1 Tax=Nocardioides sp. 1609 TaxID=2508327 RepID=UPI00106FC76E|nr:Ig-like domain repeat protein [Nocardioides sp. 1609]